MWFSSAFFRNFRQKHRVSGLFCCFPWCLCLGGSNSFQFPPKIIGFKDFKNFKLNFPKTTIFSVLDTKLCVKILVSGTGREGKSCHPQPTFRCCRTFSSFSGELFRGNMNSKYPGSITLTDFGERFFWRFPTRHENAKKKKWWKKCPQKNGFPTIGHRHVH